MKFKAVSDTALFNTWFKLQPLGLLVRLNT
jgi:hypothetical protein